jgi:L-ascorbate metabolism protein UlaG (beta-lactamase superfamily)
MAADKVRATGVDATRITPVGRGDQVSVGDISIRAVHARHLFGLEPTPDAVGYVLSCGGVSVYHSGDADYGEGATLDPQQFADTYGKLNPDGRVHIMQPAERVVVGPDGLAG